MSRTPIAAAVAFEGLALALAFGLAWALGVPLLRLFRFTAPAVAWGAAAAVGILVALLPMARSDWPPFRRLTRVVREFAARFFSDATLLDLALVSAAAGIAEEALFRGAIQVGLEDAVGTGPAIGIGALLFGLAHFVTPTYAIVATAMGIALGLLMAATGDLAAPVVAHALYDFLALFFLVRVEELDAPPEEAGS